MVPYVYFNNRGSFFGACYPKFRNVSSYTLIVWMTSHAKTFSAIETINRRFRFKNGLAQAFKKMAQAVENDFKDDDIGKRVHGVL